MVFRGGGEGVGVSDCGREGGREGEGERERGGGREREGEREGGREEEREREREGQKDVVADLPSDNVSMFIYKLFLS